MESAEPKELALNPPIVESSEGALDLPGILPLLLVAATWEFLLNRVIGLAASGLRAGDLGSLADALAIMGSFVESFALIVALTLLGHSVVTLIRQPSFGPIPHRITISGFALTVIVVGLIGTVTTVGSDAGLVAHSATVLMSALVVLGLSWHPVRRTLLLGAVLLLLPTLLRFYAACAISIPMMRTNSEFPLHAFRAAEVAAVLAALATPWLIAGLKPRELFTRPPVVAFGLAAMPMVALGASLVTHSSQVRELCLLSLGFELVLVPVQVIYPIALFCFLLTIALLVLPGIQRQRSLAEQRVGYALALLFVAGLDGLSGSVLVLSAEVGDVPELVHFLLEGHWEHLNPDHRAMIGPPLRDIYQLVILGLGYVLLARGIAEQADSTQHSERSAER